MSCYFVKGKGWRYEFILNGTRYSKAGYKTKADAKRAMEHRKEEIKNPPPPMMTPTDMGFKTLVLKCLDYAKSYNSKSHYDSYRSAGKHFCEAWGGLNCSDITRDIVEEYLLKRARVSNYTANRDLRYLRAVFNFALQRKWITENPTQGIRFLPVEKKIKYIPPREDILRVILAAESEDQPYLWTFLETMGRMSEINRLKWEDVNFQEHSIVLYTRKKRGGHLTPRKVPMTNRLYDVLTRLYAKRDRTKPWVFWHRYWSWKEGAWLEGPYQVRSKLMKNLCEKAGVKYFRYHSMRHFGASVLDHANVNIGSIQRLLGHENRTTTEIYLHSIGEAERSAMAVYEKALDNPHTLSHTESHTKEKDLEKVPLSP